MGYVIAGQQLMVGFQGTEATQESVKRLFKAIEEGKVGGVIFFKHNIVSSDQIKKLLKDFKALATPYPLFLAIDQEGGRVQRLNASNGFADFYSAFEVSKRFSPEEAYHYYQKMASMVKEAGFNVVLGPVGDLHANSKNGAVCPVIGGLERSFSENPEKVASYAEAFIQAHHDHSLLTALKHFPGHGFATHDTHKGLVDITETWDALELEPFIKLKEKADMIMGAHLVHRRFDSKDPLTLSSSFNREMLRKKVGFEGVIITDCLCMGAIQQHYSLKETVIKGLQAGNDILLFSNNAAAAPDQDRFDKDEYEINSLHIILQQALDQGLISLQEMKASFSRILSLKNCLSN
jgi:beta-N-acetylhexosaminidase